MTEIGGVPEQSYSTNLADLQARYKDVESGIEKKEKQLGDLLIAIADKSTTEIPEAFRDSPLKRLQGIAQALSDNFPAQAVIGAVLAVGLSALFD